MPTWTPIEDEIADGLEQADPTTVDTSNKKRLARECAKWADKPGSGTSSADCLLRPVFFTGSDAAEVAEHDISVLMTKPQLVKLNKRSTVGRRPFRCTGDRPTMTDCDEYPFWSTMGSGRQMTPTSATSSSTAVRISGREPLSASSTT
jgi:hypothetical protein